MKREETLDYAKEVITKREAQYGSPENVFKPIADLWCSYLTSANGTFVDVTAKDVANMMILLKIAREVNRHKDDNLIDICGYAACANELNDKEKDRDVSKAR